MIVAMRPFPAIKLIVCHIMIPDASDTNEVKMYRKEVFLIQIMDIIADARKATNVANDAPKIFRFGTRMEKVTMNIMISTNPINRIFLY